MPDFITLTCPTCGGKLQITDRISTFACGHCGNEHIVHRKGGMIYLAPLAQDVRHIRAGVDKTAAELAVARLTKEINDLDNELAEVLARTDEEWVGSPNAIKFLFGMGIVALLMTIGHFSHDRWGFGSISLVGSVGLLFYAIWLLLDRLATISDRRQAEADAINAALRTKHAQLRKNRQIAES